jgi:hypothetical protein
MASGATIIATANSVANKRRKITPHAMPLNSPLGNARRLA